jgi:ATP phosphoribosyltransferase
MPRWVSDDLVNSDGLRCGTSLAARMLRLVLPKGSLEKATLDLFEQADLPVQRTSSVQYRAHIDDPRISEVAILRPQEIPLYIEEGMYDLGITGRDWIEETGATVESLGTLQYAKATNRTIRIVLAVAGDCPWTSAADLPTGVRVSTEYVGLTSRFFERLGKQARVRLSYGATEAKIPDIADAIVELTETGSALRAAGLKIIDTVLISDTELIANPVAAADPEKRRAMAQVQTLIEGVLEARGKVLLKLNVATADLENVIAHLPALKRPTVSKLFDEGGYAVETVVPKAGINTLIPALREAGATGILEIPITKIVH